MRDYFKPWRRKVGVVTLVMACVMMVGWVRSFYSVDFIDIHYTNPTFAVLSQRGVLSSRIAFRTRFTRNTRIYLIELRDDPTRFADLPYACRYALIVMPTTLLSAWLLLSTLRPTKKPEPAPTTGV